MSGTATRRMIGEEEDDENAAEMMRRGMPTIPVASDSFPAGRRAQVTETAFAKRL
jgi:hypothetical protein